MGNNKSRPRDANTRAATAAARIVATQATAANVVALQKHIVAAAATHELSSDIIPHDDRMQQILAATVVAQKQVTRGGDSLTKDDMIAIVLVLKSIIKRESWFDKADMVGSLTREDLVASIRTIVFDPTTVQSVLELITMPVHNDISHIDEAHVDIFEPIPLSSLKPTPVSAIVPMSSAMPAPTAIVHVNAKPAPPASSIVPMSSAMPVPTAIVHVNAKPAPPASSIVPKNTKPSDAFLTVFG